MEAWRTGPVLWVPTQTFTGRLRARVLWKDPGVVAPLAARAAARGEAVAEAWLAGPKPSAKAFLARAEGALVAAWPDGRAVVFLCEVVAHRATLAKVARVALGDPAAEAFDRRMRPERRAAARLRIIEEALRLLEGAPA